jgi:tRNA (cytidine/uridine-2'-O-)-methyltransferase
MTNSPTTPHALDVDIVLIRPEIPHNTGAVGRLCVCLGARLHLIRPLGFSLTERHVRRAGLDYWENVDLTLHDDWESYLRARQPQQLVFGSTRGAQSFLACKLQPGCALVFGNETSGLPPEMYEQYADNLYHLPMPGPHSRSLNLSMSVAAFAYEAYRQLAQVT